MGPNVKHNTLFEVKILHHYFLNKGNTVYDSMSEADKAALLRGYDVRQMLSIVPTTATAALLRKHRCNFRPTGSGFIVGVQTQKDGSNQVPVIPFTNEDQFSFLVRFNDNFFSNYTALPLAGKKGQCYLLQNSTAGTAVRRFPYLSRFPAAFSAGDYSAGDIISNSATNPTQLFIAQKAINAAPPGADWLSDPLIGGKPLQYITGADLLHVSGALLRFTTGKNNLNPVVTLTNRQGIAIDARYELFFEGDQQTVLVNLHRLPENMYTLRVKDASKAYDEKLDFFLLPDDAVPPMLVHLDIKSNDADYDMLGGDDELLSPVYEMRFRNRHTRWRYLGQKFTAKPEIGPHPLTQHGVLDVSAVDDDGKTVEDLPNADVRMIKTEFPVAGKKHYNTISEIYIH